MDDTARRDATDDGASWSVAAHRLVPIGQFSDMTRLTIKALRLYAEQGLLTPAHVDPSSGYRYYRLGQANRAEAIRILRGVEMPLDEIAEVLATDDAELVGKQLDRHRERMAARLAEDQRMLRFLERLIDRGGGVMPYDVQLKDTPAQTVAMVSKHTDLSRIATDMEQGFGAIVHQIGAAGLAPAGPPFVVYHAVIDEHTAGRVDICMPIGGGAELEGEVERVDVPAQLVASTIHRGPYDEISPAYHTVTGWMAEHGHRAAGPPRELYLNDPRSVAPDELLTEVQWPVQSAV